MQLLAVVMAVGGLGPAWAPTDAKASQGAVDVCAGPPVLLRGTNGADVLSGTPGADVIDAGEGNDVIFGGGGRDVLIGGSGDDTIDGGIGSDIVVGGNGADKLLGNGGDDRLCGQNGDDLVMGGSGADVLLGGNGVDVVAGGAGRDAATGGTGADIVAGGSDDDVLRGEQGDDGLGGADGNDQLHGDHGNDRLGGFSGTDTGDGGQGVDACEVEQPSSCESFLVPTTPTVALGELQPIEGTRSYRVAWSADAPAGIVLLELYMNDEVVAYEAAARETARRGGFVIPADDVEGSSLAIYAIVTDTNGTQALSNVVSVTRSAEWEPLPPRASVSLNQPMPMSTLVAHLANAGLEPIEYQVYDAPVPPPAPDPEIMAEIRRDGLTPYVPSAVGIIYDPQDTPLIDQVAEFESYYHDDGGVGEPNVSLVILEGPLKPSDLGSLGAFATLLGNAPGQVIAAEADPAQFGQAAATADPLPPESKTGRTLDDSFGSAALALTLAAETDAFWPTYGRFNVRPFTQSRTRWRWRCFAWTTFCSFVPVEVEEEKVELEHTMVWEPSAIDGFGTRNEAYEHNVQVRSPGRRGFRRPVCNPFSDDNFYIRSETARYTTFTVPRETQLYNDTAIITDECSENEVTFGLVHPEHLDKGVPPGAVAVYTVNQEGDRDDSEDRWFRLVSQALSRENLSCDRLPVGVKHACIGVKRWETRNATIAETGSHPTPPVSLPTCLVWKWPLDRPAAGEPSILKRCGRDRDQDGFDDAIDCGPDDPAIRPDAVDIPNDGIDQNCDGSDLQVGDGRVRVTLLWDNDNDLDLHVTEPNGHEIWYANPGPSSTGGLLDRDDNVFVCGSDVEPGGVENIFWPPATSPGSGDYRVDVVEYARCSTLANWTVEVYVDDRLVRRVTDVGSGSFTFSATTSRKSKGGG